MKIIKLIPTDSKNNESITFVNYIDAVITKHTIIIEDLISSYEFQLSNYKVVID